MIGHFSSNAEYPYSLYDPAVAPKNGHVEELFLGYLQTVALPAMLEDGNGSFRVDNDPLFDTYAEVVHDLIAWLRDRDLMAQANHSDDSLLELTLVEVDEAIDAEAAYSGGDTPTEEWEWRKEHPVNEVADVAIFVFQRFAQQGDEVVAAILAAPYTDTSNAVQGGDTSFKDIAQELKALLRQDDAPVREVGHLLRKLFIRTGADTSEKILSVLQEKTAYNNLRYKKERLQSMSSEQLVWLYRYFERVAPQAFLAGQEADIQRIFIAVMKALSAIEAEKSHNGVSDEALEKYLNSQWMVMKVLSALDVSTQFSIAMEVLRALVKLDGIPEAFYSQGEVARAEHYVDLTTSPKRM